ncbi:hypothetical protein F4776DRAFT_621185 [Hypoxylon sp. NC0597]|nr:hypothetical protein F4776DRAFT_621185 [Hypoxylon sp. NC0597]
MCYRVHQATYCLFGRHHFGKHIFKRYEVCKNAQAKGRLGSCGIVSAVTDTNGEVDKCSNCELRHERLGSR